MPQRLCLAIGVANAAPLDYLPGAANAAHDIGEWARAAGFDKVAVLTDEARVGSSRWVRGDAAPAAFAAAHGVTVAAVRAELDYLLRSEPDQTDLFLLHFAGHGFQDGARSIWVTTDYETSARVIGLELLKFRLETFGIANLTIVSDACLNRVATEELANMTQDGVLDAGITGRADLQLDRFNAARQSQSAFMARSPDPARARCILSGVLVDALWGREAKAIDKYIPGKITSGSLCEFLPGRTAEVGTLYSVNSRAEVFQGQPRGHVVYRDMDLPVPPPHSPDWPKPGRSLQDIAPNMLPPGMIDHQLHGIEPPGGQPGHRDELIPPELWPINARIVAPEQPPRHFGIRKGLAAAAADAVAGANLVVAGGTVRRLWSSGTAERHGDGAWHATETTSGQLIIEFEDAVFVPVTLFSGLRTVVTRGTGGHVAWGFEGPGDKLDERQQAFDLIARMAAGTLDPAGIPQIAALIRRGKHSDPMMGAIAAYLYDYAGDRDAIRRTAWYYPAHDQPVPYDLAFLGVMPSHRRADGALSIDIPEVPKSAAKGLPDYATDATNARPDQPVAGLCPWLRQGWDFVDGPEDSELALVYGLRGLRAQLGASAFTTLNEPGGHRLIDLWQLRSSP